MGATTMERDTAALTTYRMYIGGQWMDAESGQHFESDNPFTAKPWALIPRGSRKAGLSPAISWKIS